MAEKQGPSKEDIKNQKELNKEIASQEQVISDILFIQRSLTDEVRRMVKAVTASTEQASAAKRQFREIQNFTRDIFSDIADVAVGMGSIEDLEKKQLEARKQSVQFGLEASQIMKDDLATSYLAEESDEKRASLIRDYVKNNEDLSDSEKELLELYAAGNDELAKRAGQFENLQNRQDEIEKGTGIGGKLLGGFDDVLNKVGGGKFAKVLGLGDAVDEGKKLSATLTKGGTKVATAGDKTKVLGKMLGTVGKSLMKALGPLALLAELFKGIMQADKEIVQLQKNTLATREAAAGFRNELSQAAAVSGNLNITGTKLLETFNSINEQLGFINSFSTDTLVSTTKLVKQVGLQQQTANALAALSERQGESTEDNFENVVGTTLEMQKQSGIQITQQKIFDTIAKTTGIIRANLGSNPVEIGRAVQAAAEFGAELSQVAAAGEALLNFEQSIEKELQAELLLGRDINLERARAAALQGDQVTLAQELQKQAGGFADFSAMNVIQQNALAESLGMQADELADILYKQDLQTKGAENIRAELAATGQEDAIRALESQSAADKLAATFDKLKSLFADLGVAFSPLLGIVVDLVGLLNLVIAPIADLINIIVRGTQFLFGKSDAFKDFEFATDDAFGMGTADDVNMGIPAGYGETIIKRPKGSIALNDDDKVNITAGTNLNQNQGNSMAGLERKFDVLIAATRANKMEASSFYATA
tara:strand:+ start:6451 stop:8577 length:2127 start_codon:yes stop_codon:yes gene_type:complete